MEIGIHANMVDLQTARIGDKLRDVFKVLSSKLNSDYGGIIEHLWIGFELVERHAKSDGKPKFPFRFAKRVSGRSTLGLPSRPDHFNVGHLSVRPNFSHLLSIPEDEIIPYCLSLIYTELLVLKAKEKKLGSFNSEMLRDKFLSECTILGYPINMI